MIASATPQEYQKAIEVLLAAEEVDALIVIYIPVIAETETISQAIHRGVVAARAAGPASKPVLACMMVGEGLTGSLKFEEETIPTFAFPESVARVLSRVAQYADWRRLPLGMVPDFDHLDIESARSIVEKAIRERGPGWLTSEEIQGIFKAVGLPQAPGGLARTAEEAVKIAEVLGFPVAAKVSSLQIVHKTEVGGVRLNLADPDTVREAFLAIQQGLEASGNLPALDGIWIQPMISEGVEVMIGVAEDPVFGPLVAFGLGGDSRRSPGGCTLSGNPAHRSGRPGTGQRDPWVSAADRLSRESAGGYRGPGGGAAPDFTAGGRDPGNYGFGPESHHDPASRTRLHHCRCPDPGGLTGEKIDLPAIRFRARR